MPLPKLRIPKVAPENGGANRHERTEPEGPKNILGPGWRLLSVNADVAVTHRRKPFLCTIVAPARSAGSAPIPPPRRPGLAFPHRIQWRIYGSRRIALFAAL